ncbi:MAG: hypothetical protein OXC30_06470, partial [Alphaproteobacteria bacterium]|nr:hypothetical protein [Alphaproteobacteria bacterium]
MINITIFSLFMCMVNADAAEAAADPGWLTGVAARSNYSTLQYNLIPYGITFKQSVMLQVCAGLSQSVLFQNENPVRKAEIDIILCLLCQKSVENAAVLAKTFHEEDESMCAGRALITESFGRCVPPLNLVHPDYIKKIQKIFDLLRKHPLMNNPGREKGDKVVHDLNRRYYKREGFDRFSLELQNNIWRVYPISADTDSQPETYSAEGIGWLKGESAKRHYTILQSNLEKKKTTVRNSLMLQVCCALSQTDCSQDKQSMLKIEIATILYILSQESSSNAEGLAETFRGEDAQVSQGKRSVIEAFGRCIPKVTPNSMEPIFRCLPNDYNMAQGLYKIRRYYKLKGTQRFSILLKSILWERYSKAAGADSQPDTGAAQAVVGLTGESAKKYYGILKSKLEQDGITVAAGADSQPDTGAAQAVVGLTGESAKKYYGILKSKLEQDGITVANSVMLKVCGELSQSDCFQKEHTELQVGIATALYILCQESVRNAKGLAHTFSKEGEKV